MASSTDRAPSPASGLARVLKGRRGRKEKLDNTSNLSLTSESTTGDGSAGLRNSLDGALDRLRHSSDERRGSTESLRRRTSIFRIGRKRKKDKRSQDEEDNAPDEGSLDASRPATIASSSRTGTGLESGEVSPGEESSTLHQSVTDSLVTDESDDDIRPIRPSLSPHQSHAGYLTLSSPLIAVEAAEAVESDKPPPISFEATPKDDNLAPKHAKTLDAPSSRKRSPSPVGKLRGAFVPSKRSSTLPKASGDSDSDRSAGGGGGGRGGLFPKKGGGASSKGSRLAEESLAPEVSGEEPSATVKGATPPQRIVTVLPATPPNPAEAPTTFVTPPTPTEQRSTTSTPPISTSNPYSDTISHRASQSNPNIASPSGNMPTHRRARSATNPPSKLSNSISAPLSPTIEETKTPGGSLTASPPGGFFSSAFSAVQNAASSLSSTIANTGLPGQKNKGAAAGGGDTEKTGQAGGEEVIVANGADSLDSPTEGPGIERRQLAVETLGSGNLSLAHLGISDNSSDTSPMASTVDVSEREKLGATVVTDEASSRLEGTAAAQAVQAAYAERPAERFNTANNDRGSVYAYQGAQTPPRTQANESDTSLIKRSGSVRSRISGGRRRRHRGSSATTGNTIAAAISSSTTTLANPGAVATGQRLTGFAVASSKRNRDFHQLFRSVPEDDYLIEDYSAALQRDILLQGRLYISEGHLCFASNILGWITNLVISFDEVVSVEKKTTAFLFPNAIVIQTLHARNVFASFVSRDTTYDLIIGIWKISHPNLKSSLNGVMLDDSGTGDKTEKAESMGSLEGSDEDSEDEVYDEDAEEEEGIGSFVEAADGSVAGSDAGEAGKTVSRKTSAAAVGALAGGGSAKMADNAEAAATGAKEAADFPGPAAHAPTECGDEATHYDKVLIDTVLPAPLGKIYSLMFGPTSGAFMRKWLIEDQKSTELTLEDDKKGLGEDRKTLTFSYIKPLNAAIGPRQTKCIISQTLVQFDLDKTVIVDISTQNPDVPSGNVFLVKTRYCLMWAPANSTRMIMHFTIEWTGKSWLKGPIEKGTNDGQSQYAKDLVAALRAAVATRARLGAPRGKGKGKRKEKIPDLADVVIEAQQAAADQKKRQEEAAKWGILEPVRPLISPVTDVVGSLVSTQVLIALLSLLTLVLWWRQSAGYGYGSASLGIPGLATPARIAAYEEMWRREESELWRWLEERAVMDGLSVPSSDSTTGRKRSARIMQSRLEDEEMTEREIDEAIKITQQRLDALKDAVARRRAKPSIPGKGPPPE